MIRRMVSFFLFAACMILPVEAFPQVSSEIQAVWSDTSFEGEYAGTMNVAMSKGKTVKGREATFVLITAKPNVLTYKNEK